MRRSYVYLHCLFLCKAFQGFRDMRVQYLKGTSIQGTKIPERKADKEKEANMEILLFGGTSEGRRIADYLRGRSCKVTVCVASEYGASLVTEGENISVMTGRMDRNEMTALMNSRHFDCVVDATHPYALEATDNISASAFTTGITLYRVVREGYGEGNWIWAENTAKAAELLSKLSGNILLTTGSKELDIFAGSGLAGRCFPRVLPSIESLGRCLELGYPRENIICMQGPFSKELNIAMMRQFNIETVVTKDTGSAGGFSEKAEAAVETGCSLIVIGRARQEKGLNADEMINRLEYELGV